MLSSSLCFSQRQYSLLCLGTWVNMARHKMVAINRYMRLEVATVEMARWLQFSECYSWEATIQRATIFVWG